MTSLDQDMRQLRLGRYTPQAANEIRRWIEETLGERLAPGDLMDALRDGVALCKLINLAVSPGVKYKASNMPFVQMENISHFLKACEMPPLSLPAHDRFLTVDLYDNKDPAQVLQCIAAFSRRASAVNSAAFPVDIGGKNKGASMSPENTGPGSSPYTPRISSYTSNPSQNATSPQSPSYGVRSGSPTKSNSLSRGGLASGGPVSSWSKKEDENRTAPAWNIHQYGYMGGASQGNQGVSFGSRRQITSTAPEVPSLAEKEKRLREKLEREQQELAENEQRTRAQREADEAQAQEEEQRRWEEETRRAREEEDLARRQEEARLRREEQARNDLEAEQRIIESRNRQRTTSDARLNGQFLSQYQASQKTQPPQPARTTSQIDSQPSGEAQRIAELERQLAEMKAQAAERERLERQQQQQQQQMQASQQEVPLTSPTTTTRPKPLPPTRSSQNVQTSHEDDWNASEREYLKKAHQAMQVVAPEATSIPHTPPPAPQPTHAEPAEPVQPQQSQASRPLPDPTTYQPNTTRTSRYLSSNPAPTQPQSTTHIPAEAAHSTTAEVDAENSRRVASQRSTRAGGWASKSLLEREMERERERQREWEDNQRVTASAARDMSQGSGPGQSWDVHQYGYTGGDNQNRGGPGLGMGGARRQVVGGPRPLPATPQSQSQSQPQMGQEDRAGYGYGGGPGGQT